MYSNVDAQFGRGPIATKLSARPARLRRVRDDYGSTRQLARQSWFRHFPHFKSGNPIDRVKIHRLSNERVAHTLLVDHSQLPPLGSDPLWSTRNASIPAELTFRNHSTSLRDAIVGETHRGDRTGACQRRDSSASSKPSLGNQHWDGRLFRSGGGRHHAWLTWHAGNPDAPT